MNLVVLTGRVGNISELRQGKEPRRIKFLTLSISTQEIFRGGKEQTTWHKIMVFGSPAEFVSKYLKNGDQINVLGKLQYRQWKDDDGIDRKLTEIVAKKVWLIARPKKNQEEDTEEEEAEEF